MSMSISSVFPEDEEHAAQNCAEIRTINSTARILDFRTWEHLPFLRHAPGEIDINAFSAEICGNTPPERISFPTPVARTRASACKAKNGIRHLRRLGNTGFLFTPIAVLRGKHKTFSFGYYEQYNTFFPKSQDKNCVFALFRTKRRMTAPEHFFVDFAHHRRIFFLYFVYFAVSFFVTCYADFTTC